MVKFLLGLATASNFCDSFRSCMFNTCRSSFSKSRRIYSSLAKFKVSIVSLRVSYSFIIALMIATPALADDVSYLKPYLKGEAVEVGHGKYYYKGLIHAYDAALFTADGKFDENKPYALVLTYVTDIDGDDIADKSIEEMNKIEPVDKSKSDVWLAEMKKIFPDVVDGTVLAGVNVPHKGTVFIGDGKKIGGINDPEFSKAFFDIWLSPKTTGEELRAKLLGEKQ